MPRKNTIPTIKVNGKKSLDESLLNRIVRILHSSKSGLGVAELCASLVGVSRKVLGKHIAWLRSEGLIFAEGVTRNTTYRLV